MEKGTLSPLKDHCLQQRCTHFILSGLDLYINPSLAAGTEELDFQPQDTGGSSEGESRLFWTWDWMLPVGATSHSSFLSPVADTACVSTEEVPLFHVLPTQDTVL